MVYLPSMNHGNDNSSLKWIKGELDSSISTARRSLERYAEGAGAEDQIDECISRLHQVHGTLQMVQLYGAAMLAEEMELVALALKEGTTRKRGEAAESLMLGLVQLPVYLEKLESGARDIPLLLLPMLNELRATREEPLLSEVAMFAPQLEQKLSADQVSGEPNPELPALARSLRHAYHKGLLDWYRDSDPEGGLRRISQIMRQLMAAAGTDQGRRLFRIAGAVSNALAGGSIDTGVATKLLLGKVDRELKRVIDQGELPIAESPANELLKSLLYYTACADSSDPLVRHVKHEFDLDNSLVSQAELDQGREGLHAPGKELLESLQSAIGDDLTVIKDGVDLFIRSSNRELERLQALEEPMRKLADTLGMVGQGGLRQRMKRQADRIAEIVATEEMPEEKDLMAMASDILYIESSLGNLTTSARPRAKAREHLLPDLPESEFGHLIDTVIQEATVEMARSKEAVVGFINNPERIDLLSEVPRRFRDIAGAFRILNFPDAAKQLEALAHYVHHQLLDKGIVPPTETLNTFADAVTGIEFFMESVAEGNTVKPEIIEMVDQAIIQLEDVSRTELDLPDEGEPVADAGVQEESAEEAAEAELPEKTVPQQPLDQIDQSAASIDKPPLEEIDEEILDIFIEEAKEELAVIQEYLPRWRNDREDQDALITFRRSFHTLKGSGRLVGAMTIGEFAWSIENLLNRVIDQTIEVSPAVLDLLDETLKVLPEMISSQESGAPLSCNVTPMMERAFTLADPSAATEEIKRQTEKSEKKQLNQFQGEGADQPQGEETPVEDAATPEEGAEEIQELLPTAEVLTFPGGEAEETATETLQSLEPLPGIEEDGEEEPEPSISMDPALLDIFESESRTHIDTLKHFLSSCREDPSDCRMAKELTRALHTLHGSADMAQVESIAAVSAALEATAHEMQSHREQADPEMLELIQRGADVFEQVLDVINLPGGELPDWQKLMEQIAEYRERPRPQPESSQSVSEETGYAEQDTQPALQTAVSPLPVEQEPEEQQLADETPEAEPAAEQTPVEVTPEPESGVEMVALDGDPELAEIFLEEARELLESIENSVHGWQQNPDDLVPVADLQRTLHTLKGGARLAGAMPIGDLSHAFESLLTAIGSGQVESGDEVMQLSHLVTDRLNEQIEDLSRGPKLRSAAELVDRLAQILDPGAVPQAKAPTEPEQPPADAEPAERVESDESKGAAQIEVVPETPAETSVEVSVEAPPVTPLVEENRSAHKANRGREQVRVRSELLDRLVNNAGEVSIYRSRLEQQNNSLGFNLSELEQTIERLRSQLRNLEIETETQILFRYEKDQEEGKELDESFDPLELDRFSTMQQLSRSLLETVNDLNSLNEILEDQHRETETLLLQQSRITTDLQDGLLRTRMVPFAQLIPRLRRVVRQTCGPLNKKAELDVRGAEGEIDRGILDRMVGPLEHLLRNAVSHGIEPPAKRAKRGKKEIGQVTLNLTREGSDVLLTISDDGAGLRIKQIRKQAIEDGLLDPHAEVPDSDILQFVLEHGFSTADEVTQIAGRGVGLDVVLSEVKQLGGSLDIQSEEGKGTSFIIRLPLTLAISDALLVELAEEVYAIPHTSIEGVVRVARQELLECYDGSRTAFSYAGQDYQVKYLGNLLGSGTPNLGDQRKWHPLLLVRAGEHRVALQVDGILGNRQVVVKSVGIQISSVRWISGGTILGDGRVALILDVAALVRMDVAHTAVAPVAEDADKADLGVGRTVMVVDDSITVRKVTGRLLERHGMQVLTAKDGVDAVAVLQEQHPDIMLLDIEMPRMDGYELARHMRNSETLNHIPIIMITSRAGDKHRKLAMELGVKRYLSKPYQEDDLLDNIYSVLAEVLQ